MDIAAWLRELGLERYQQAFQDNEVDARSLPLLTADDLEQMGVRAIGHRRLLLQAIADLQPQAIADLQQSGALAVEPLSAAAIPSAGAGGVAEAASQAERRQLTVMFVDLVGSTALSTCLDPEDMRDVIRAYQDTCAGMITRFEGHVAKYMGDGVLAYFGWPRAHEDEAERAVRAGLALVGAVGGLRTPADEPLAARVGIATGLVVVGELVGDDEARERTVVGETPNLAARLQALADPGQVVIAAATQRLVRAGFELRDLGEHELKGIAEPITAFAAVGELSLESRFEARSGPSLLPMVGRDQELALLAERWLLAKSGEGQGVLLVGEAGIGKSRIMRALLDTVADEPHTRVRYQCSPYHRDSALWPVIQQLGHAAGFAGNDPPEARLDKLEALLGRAVDDAHTVAPLIADLMGLDGRERYGELGLTPQAQRARTLDALVEQVLGLAEREPVLVVLEDAHWIDPSTLEMIAQSLDRVATARVLILLTSRTDQQPDVAAHPHVTRLTLNRLGRAAVEAIVARLGGERLPTATIVAIIARTDGVPLFVEELTKAILETGEATIPASLHDSLMARLDRIPDVKEIAQLAACLGRDFSHGLLAAVAERPEAELVTALDKLTAAGLIFRRGTPPDARYTFKHALVQDAAYQSLLNRTRQHYHRRVAELIEARFPETAQAQPELVAHHYTEAGQAEPAIEFWRRAGRRAAERSANGEAISHLNRALTVLFTLPEGVERDSEELDLQIALTGPVTGYMGYAAPETERVYARALELCERVGESPKIFPVLFGWFSFYIAQGHAAKCLEFAEDFFRRAERLDDDTFRMIGHRMVGAGSLTTGMLAPAIVHLERAIALYDVDRHRDLALTYAHDVKVSALCLRGLALWIHGYPGRAKASAKEGLDLAEVLSHATTMGYAQMVGGTYLHSLCRDDGRVRDHAEAALAFSAEHAMPAWAASARWALASITTEPIPSEADLAAMRQALGALEAARFGFLLPVMLGQLAEACHRAGNRQEAKSALERARAVMGETGDRLAEAELHRIEGGLLLAGDSVVQAQAEACYCRAIEVARRQEARSWELRAATSLARLWRDQGKRQEAHNLLAPVYDWFTEGFDTADLKDAKALLDELA